MIDLGSMTDKFSETGQKVVRRAIDVSKLRDHNFLSVLHVFTALSEVERDLFIEAMRAAGVDLESVARLLDQELSESPRYVGRNMGIPEPTRDLFNNALRRARKHGRRQIESYDLFAALFNDRNGGPAEILRRLGVDLALAADAISQAVRTREQQTFGPQLRHIPKIQRIHAPKEQTSSVTFSKHTPIIKFSDLTAENLRLIVRIEEKGVTPDLWDKKVVSLTEQERQGVESIVSSIQNKPVVLMNEATTWSRAIYPLLVLAEQGRLEAWSQAPLKAEYPEFGLNGTADGVVGQNISGVTKSFCLIVVAAKQGPEAQGPLIQLYGTMLAAARLNWELDKRVPQEIFGCYTVADNWTFMRGLVSDIEADRPTMTVASSREYAEKVEAETILRVLKSITGKCAQGVADAA
jgi:Clp amino terminal domain, pathogenicity island component